MCREGISASLFAAVMHQFVLMKTSRIAEASQVWTVSVYVLLGGVLGVRWEDRVKEMFILCDKDTFQMFRVFFTLPSLSKR